ncbi:MAG: hypothetical protein RLZZ248_1413 [Bacteroidota bacterium]
MSTERKQINREAMKFFNNFLQANLNAQRAIQRMLVMAFSCVFAIATTAQGWELNFGGNSLDEGQAIIATPDGGSLIVGYAQPVGLDLDQDISINAIRTDVDGTVIWNQFYDDGFDELAFDVAQLNDGNFVIVGYIRPTQGANTDIYLLKINPYGKKLWHRVLGGSFNDQAKGVVALPDGGFAITGFTSIDGSQSQVLVSRFTTDGEQVWQQTFGGGKDDAGAAIAASGNQLYILSNWINPNGSDSDIYLHQMNLSGELGWNIKKGLSNVKDLGNDLIVTQDGNLLIAGEQGNVGQAYLSKHTLDGEFLWEKSFGGSLGDDAKAVVEDQNGNFLITGAVETSEINVDLLLAKTDKEGNLIWSKNHGRVDQFFETGNGIAINALTGQYLISGSLGRFSSFDNDILLLKADVAGEILTNHIKGRVFFDENGDCGEQTNEKGLAEWIVVAEKEGVEYFASTNEQGYFDLRVDTGFYTVAVISANDHWMPCFEMYDVFLQGRYEEEQVDFSIQQAKNCPYPEVQVSTVSLTACTSVSYEINYLNHGPVVANDAYVEVTLDEELTYLSGDLPYIKVEGNQYTFNVGTIDPLEKGSFTIHVTVNCQGILNMQAVKVTAEIFPSSGCGEIPQEWDQSDLKVETICEGDKVAFRVRNTGTGNMQMASKSFVIEDDVMFAEEPIQLESEKDTLMRFEKNGSTYRIIVEQPAFHPARSITTIASEGCVTDGQEYSTGKMLMFPEDEEQNNIDIDVEETIDSEIATMRGYPKGYQDSILENKTDITYKIVFRNNGVDTLDRVVIRDTLSENLDLTTLRAGVSNFPFTLEVMEERVVKITFTDLKLLPNSSAGAVEDNSGFVTFSVSQKPDLPPGTVIENSAAIFYGLNAPERSNSKKYIVGSFPGFVQITTSSSQIFWPGVSVTVIPNPFFDQAIIEVKGVDMKETLLNVYDAMGRLIRSQKSYGNQIQMSRGNLTSGLYFYQLLNENELINTGKIIVR